MPPWLPRFLRRPVPRHSTASSLQLGPPTPPTHRICSLCHTASRAQHPSPPPAHNTPTYVPLLKEIEQRRDEARRSILVQVRPRSHSGILKKSLCRWKDFLPHRILVPIVRKSLDLLRGFTFTPIHQVLYSLPWSIGTILFGLYPQEISNPSLLLSLLILNLWMLFSD